MHQMRYIPYPVVNLIFDKPVFNKGYDTWCPGNTFTDFIVADWVVRNQPGYKQKYNILSCYTPMEEDDRGYLLTETGSRKVAEACCTISRSYFPERTSIRSKCTSTAAAILCTCRRPAIYTKVQPLVRQPWTGSSSRTRIRKGRYRRPAEAFTPPNVR